MLSGRRSLYVIWRWGRLQDAATLAALGFTCDQTPAVSTLQLVFRQLDVVAFEAALGSWAQGILGDRREAIAIDGKALRGIHGEELPGVRLVSVSCDAAGLVLAQPADLAAEPRRRASGPRDSGGQGSEYAGELTLAPTLLGRVPLAGRVVTGDALYCQRGLCQQILDAGGDYLVVVKANQPDLYDDLALLFAPPPGEACMEAVQHDKGHGRREVRRLWVSAALAGDLDWPVPSRSARWSASSTSGGSKRGRYAIGSRVRRP